MTNRSKQGALSLDDLLRAMGASSASETPRDTLTSATSPAPSTEPSEVTKPMQVAADGNTIPDDSPLKIAAASSMETESVEPDKRSVRSRFADLPASRAATPEQPAEAASKQSAETPLESVEQPSTLSEWEAGLRAAAEQMGMSADDVFAPSAPPIRRTTTDSAESHHATAASTPHSTVKMIDFPTASMEARQSGRDLKTTWEHQNYEPGRASGMPLSMESSFFDGVEPLEIQIPTRRPHPHAPIDFPHRQQRPSKGGNPAETTNELEFPTTPKLVKPEAPESESNAVEVPQEGDSSAQISSSNEQQAKELANEDAAPIAPEDTLPATECPALRLSEIQAPLGALEASQGDNRADVNGPTVPVAPDEPVAQVPSETRASSMIIPVDGLRAVLPKITCAILLVLAGAFLASAIMMIGQPAEAVGESQDSIETVAAAQQTTSTAVYRYAITGTDGTGYACTEVAEFDEDDVLQRSTLAVDLPSSEEASKFLNQAKTDFGDSLIGEEVKGKVATFQVSMSDKGLPKDTYTALLKETTKDCQVIVEL